jgi:hypothetical protein
MRHISVNRPEPEPFMPRLFRLRRLTLPLVLATGMGTAALASEHDCRVPMADWQPIAAVNALMQKRGLTVRRIKIDDGCYEVKARDAKGNRVELRLDPGTLRVLEPERQDDD